jgi:hypothetical protein
VIADHSLLHTLAMMEQQLANLRAQLAENPQIAPTPARPRPNPVPTVAAYKAWVKAQRFG